jgi:hypothetical protein
VVSNWPCGQQSRLESGGTPTRKRVEATHSQANGIDCGASLALARLPAQLAPSRSTIRSAYQSGHGVSAPAVA